MADFSVNVPEVGGGDIPRITPTSPATVAAQGVGNLANSLGDVANGIVEGRRMHQQLLIRQATGAAEADLTTKLSGLADAVDRGDVNSAFARTQARALTTQAISNNPMLTNELQSVHDRFIGDTGSGAVINKGTQQEQQETSLRVDGQKAGWVDPSLPIDSQMAQAHNWQQFNVAKDKLSALQSQVNYTNSQLTTQKDMLDIQKDKQDLVTGGLTQTLDRLKINDLSNEIQAKGAVGQMTDAYSTKLTGDIKNILDKVDLKNPDSVAQASLAIDQATSSLKAATTSAMGGYGASYVNNITAPMQSTIDAAKNYINGKTTRDVYDNQVNNNLGRQKLMITGDGENARTIAGSQLLQNPYLSLPALGAAAVRIFSGNSDPSQLPHNMAQPSKQGQQDVKSYGDSLLQGMKTLQSSSPGVNHKALGADVDTNVGQMLTGVDAYQLAVKNPGDYKNLVNILADPTFGKYMVDRGGTLPAGAAAGAKTVLQRDYTDVGVNLMREQYYKALNDPLTSAASGSNATTAYVPNTEQPKDMTVRAEKIEPVFNGSGVMFVARDGKPDSATLASVRDLNRNVAPALNTLVRLDSHLSGNTNYEKTWNDRYAPMFQRLEPKPQQGGDGGGGSNPQ